MNKKQHQLLVYISQISFAMYEAALFLDTHPCDGEAMAYYQDVSQKRRKAMKEYAREYAPLVIDDVTCDNVWQWVETPWPWEF